MKYNIFYEKAIEKHGNFYDYSKVPDEFTVRDKICIICPIHGEFYLRADTHLEGKGCSKCGHCKTGLATRKDSSLSLEKIQLSNITIVENPKISTNEIIVGSIYLFVNTINNKLYVGKTVRSYITRWTLHKTDSVSSNLYFHRAINKYGWENFNRYVIWQSEEYSYSEENKKIVSDLLSIREIEYIKLFLSNNPNFGYNITSGGEGSSRVVSNETKQKLKYTTGAKSVDQFDLEGNLVKTWYSMSDIRKELGYCKDGVRECCNNERDSYKGFIWKFSDKKHPDQMLPKNKKLKHSQEIKAILLYTLKGEFVREWESAKQIFEELGYDDHCIRGCCRNLYKTSNGFIWLYKDSNIIDKQLSELILDSRGCINKPIGLYSKHNVLIKIWDSLDDIVNVGFSRPGIRNVLNGKNKTSANYIWKYENL